MAAVQNTLTHRRHRIDFLPFEIIPTWTSPVLPPAALICVTCVDAPRSGKLPDWCLTVWLWEWVSFLPLRLGLRLTQSCPLSRSVLGCLSAFLQIRDRWRGTVSPPHHPARETRLEDGWMMDNEPSKCSDVFLNEAKLRNASIITTRLTATIVNIIKKKSLLLL